jgi:hypothetical protein
MYLGVDFDQPPLASRQRPGDRVDGVDAEDDNVILIVGMECGR